MELTQITPSLNIQQEILSLARQSILNGITNERPLRVDCKHCPSPLKERRSCYVTLTLKGAERGQSGSIGGPRPLIDDVVTNAFLSAFRDPKFRPITQQEFEDLRIEISLLNDLQELDFDQEDQLLDSLRPGIDGLRLSAGAQGATLIPRDWTKYPSPKEFLEALKLKMAFPRNYWSKNFRAFRFQSKEISERPPQEHSMDLQAS